MWDTEEPARDKMTVVPLFRMSKSCVLPPPLRLFEVVLVIDVVPLVMGMVVVKVISLVTTQVFPPAVAQLERAEKVETEDVARSRGCGKSWPKNGCLVLPVLFNVDARPCPVKNLHKRSTQV